MPKNSWNPADAPQSPTPLSERIYTSRLLGRDSSLVLHGGGNVSVKDFAVDLWGNREPVLYVKGSGWDMADIAEAGLPGLWLKPLLRLLELPSLGDDTMMAELRRQLLLPNSPDPSVETLLHAGLPHKFVDHTHADAVVTLSNQPEGEKILRELYGDRVGYVPYVMPGFDLALECMRVFRQNSKVEGLILLRHGIFTFGETAKESYDRMIRLVSEAEGVLTAKAAKPAVVAHAERSQLGLYWAAALRRLITPPPQPKPRAFCIRWVESEAALQLAGHPKAASLAQRGPLTPDHILRTKQFPLFIPRAVVEAKDQNRAQQLLADYCTNYENYFRAESNRAGGQKQPLDPMPRVVVLEGVGIVTLGNTPKDAKIAADIFEHTAVCIAQAESMGGYQALGASDLFDVEYWVLEQNKLKLAPKLGLLTGKVAVVTGGARGIGLAICSELLAAGAVVHCLDLTPPEKLLPNALTFYSHTVDISSQPSISSVFDTIVRTSGAVDILINNAGIFPASAALEDTSLESWEKSLQVNLNGSFFCSQQAMRWMKVGARGGDIIFVASKNVPAPGKNAGAYSVAKAAQTQLARILALEGGEAGIRVNSLHPHLIFDTGLWAGGLLEKRAAAYGMTPEQYRSNNLLQTELSSTDVAAAVRALVCGDFSKTTGAQICIDGGSDRTV